MTSISDSLFGNYEKMDTLTLFINKGTGSINAAERRKTDSDIREQAKEALSSLDKMFQNKKKITPILKEHENELDNFCDNLTQISKNLKSLEEKPEIEGQLTAKTLKSPEQKKIDSIISFVRVFQHSMDKSEKATSSETKRHSLLPFKSRGSVKTDSESETAESSSSPETKRRSKYPSFMSRGSVKTDSESETAEGSSSPETKKRSKYPSFISRSSFRQTESVPTSPVEERKSKKSEEKEEKEVKSASAPPSPAETRKSRLSKRFSQMWGKQKKGSKESVEEVKTEQTETVTLSPIEAQKAARMQSKKLIEWLKENDADQIEGVFRQSGSADEIKALMKITDEGSFTQKLKEFEKNPQQHIHTVTVALKTIVRNHPFISGKDTERFLKIKDIKDPEEQIQTLRSIIEELDPKQRQILKELFVLLDQITQNSQNNKMTPNNLAISWGTNVIDRQGLNLSKTDPFAEINLLQQVAVPFELLIANHDTLFENL